MQGMVFPSVETSIPVGIDCFGTSRNGTACFECFHCGSRADPADVCEWEGITCNDDGEVEEFHWINKTENGTGTLSFEFLPWSMKTVNMFMNALSANPTKGHLSVVGWTSTPVLGEAKNLFKPLVVFLSWRRPY